MKKISARVTTARSTRTISAPREVSHTKLEKRPYESKAVRDLRTALPKHKRVLAVAPTGAGKTVIASMLIRAEPRWLRVLWLAHRVELISQARTRLMLLGVPCGVRCTKYETLHPNHINSEARVQIGSIQTVVRHEVEDIDLIVIDEAHRALAKTYQKIVSLQPSAEILGLTATPRRLDKRGLGNFFQSMIVLAKPSALYKDDYLAAPVTFAGDPAMRDLVTKRLRTVSVVHGDFQAVQLGRAMSKTVLVANVVKETLRLAPHVPKVVFAATVAHSKKLAARFKRHGIMAAHIDGKTSTKDRERILSELTSGGIEVVCNVDVLTEGWDCPALGAVVVARPTKSLARFMHMIGRAQRVGGTKRKLVLDFGGNSMRLEHFPGEDVEWSLDHGQSKHSKTVSRIRVCINPKCNTVLRDACEKCPQCGAAQPKSEARKIEELKGQLVELDRERFEKLRAEIRERAEKVARDVKAPPGWVNKVVDAVVSSA